MSVAQWTGVCVINIVSWRAQTCALLFHRDGIQVQTMGLGVGNTVLKQKLRTILPSFLKGGTVKYVWVDIRQFYLFFLKSIVKQGHQLRKLEEKQCHLNQWESGGVREVGRTDSLCWVPIWDQWLQFERKNVIIVAWFYPTMLRY